MRPAASTFLASAALCGCLCFARGAQADAVDPARRWIPGLAISSTGLFQDRSSTVSTVERGDFDGDTTAAIWSMTLNGSLASPELFGIPGRPRLFIRGGFSAYFDNEEPLVNDGDPGTPIIPTRVAGGGAVPLQGVPKRGSGSRAEAEPFGFQAGIGASFETTLWDRILRIRPSLEYTWQEDRLRGVFGEAESEGSDPDFCDPACRLIAIDETESEVFHSLGPGIELETDVGRVGEFVLSIFASGQALAVLGNRELQLRGTAGWTTDGAPSAGRADSTLDVSFRRERWHYRAGLGFRMVWFPEVLEPSR